MAEQILPPSGYRVFTRRFDKVVQADALPSRFSTERAWDLFMEQTLERRTAWELTGLEHAERLRAAGSTKLFQDTLVTLLIDHSGSMRGDRVLLTAAAVEVARRFLDHLGVRVEVLGFTTRSWRGGLSRTVWRWTGRRQNPGRLCDLLHIVYEEAGSSRSSGRSLTHMLDPLLLKENVDGEAILWAASRQERQPHRYKAIVVISDGAPVDDSTLQANGPNILMDHLNDVVGHLQKTRMMAQLQIGHEIESRFPLSTRVETLADMGTALFGLLADVLLVSLPNKPNSNSRAS